MASIKGWQLKGLKTFQGRDWEGSQGTLYYNGKRAGWYNDSGDGSMADIDLNTKELQEQFDKAVKDYYAEHPLTGRFADLTPDGELFMGELLRLMENEKSYKRMVKQELPYVVAFKESPNAPYITIVGVRTKDGRQRYIEERGIKEYDLYDSLEDFIIK